MHALLRVLGLLAAAVVVLPTHAAANRLNAMRSPHLGHQKRETDSEVSQATKAVLTLDHAASVSSDSCDVACIKAGLRCGWACDGVVDPVARGQCAQKCSTEQIACSKACGVIPPVVALAR